MKRLVMVVLLVLIVAAVSSCGDKHEVKKVVSGEQATKEVKKDIEEKDTPTPEKKVEEEVKMVKLPDVSDTDLDSAKAVLINKGFLITIKEKYSDTVPKGNVIGTEPEGGTMLEENSKIVLLVSKGPSLIDSKNSTISWYPLDSKSPDKWEFASPFIVDEYLYILCAPTFGVDFCFKNTGFGTASISDTFDKQTPIRLFDSDLLDFPEEKQVKKGEEQEFYIRIPLAQLDSDRPTHVACRISVLVGAKKEERNIDVSFSISW